MEDPIEQEIKTELDNVDAQTEETCENAENETEQHEHDEFEQQPVEQTEQTVKEENGDQEELSKKEVDEDDRKLFIGGLSWETQTNALKDYMSQFGEVDTCTIKMDSKTGRSRCFGFVIFKEVEAVDKVLQAKTHTVDGRDIDAKKAEPQRREGKLFVGGIKPETTDLFLRQYFEFYGEIEKMERPYDQKNSKPRGFCFITFKKDGPITKITENRYHELEGKSVECKHADPPSRSGYGGGRGGRDGGRGGMGGWNNRFGYGGGNYGGGYGGGFGGGGGAFGGGGGGGYGVGYGGFGGGFGDGYGAGYGGGFGGGGGGGYGNFGGGGYGFSGHQQSGYGKAPGGRGRHQNNFKPY